jgi:hypothetical protein
VCQPSIFLNCEATHARKPGSNSNQTWFPLATFGPHTALHLTASSLRSCLAPASSGR